MGTTSRPAKRLSLSTWSEPNLSPFRCHNPLQRPSVCRLFRPSIRDACWRSATSRLRKRGQRLYWTPRSAYAIFFSIRPRLYLPCLTLRENTERPVTVDEGSNVLAGTDPERIVALALQTIAGNGKRGRRPNLWDGNAAVRIVDALVSRLTRQ